MMASIAAVTAAMLVDSVPIGDRPGVQGVSDLMDTGVKRISAHQLMLLHGAPLANPESREKHGLKTRFRVVARDVGRVSAGDATGDAAEAVPDRDAPLVHGADVTVIESAATPLSGSLGPQIGAVFSDLAMQFFGLSSVAALVPAVIWGFFLSTARGVDRMSKRAEHMLLLGRSATSMAGDEVRRAPLRCGASDDRGSESALYWLSRGCRWRGGPLVHWLFSR